MNNKLLKFIVLNNYYKTYDIDKCRIVLSLIKADIKLFEEIR